MRTRLVTALLVPALLAVTAGAAGVAGAAVGTPSAAVDATLVISTATPKVEVPMRYWVTVTNAAGKPLAAKITVRIKDPFGGVHPVEFDTRKVAIVNHPIVGRFRDQVEWPQSAVGFALKFQVLVRIQGKTLTLTRTITTRG